MKIKGILVSALLLIVGCSPPRWIEKNNVKIKNIESVFINKPDDYTILVREENQLIAKSIKATRLYYNDVGNWVKVFTDSKDENWAVIREYENIGGGNQIRKTEIEIHIQSVNNIQGGKGW